MLFHDLYHGFVASAPCVCYDEITERNTVMDQIAIGKFISECRKEKHLTQAQLAERLGVTDRAVSKWETGRSLPDASIMLELCEQIGVTVNDLFNARRIDMENYKEIAEKTMLEIREREEQTAKKLLSYEIVIAVISLFVFLSLFGIALLADLPHWLQGTLIGIGLVQLMVCSFFAVKIEAEAGYYECPNCGERYVPSYFSALMAPHMGRSRRMRCPHCNKKGYHKKVLTKEK